MSSRYAAVDALLSELRAELLVGPGDETFATHVAMMRFEAEHAPLASRTSANRGAVGHARERVQERVRRAATTNPRRFAALVAAVCVMFGSLGLDAAGALPSAVRHLTSHITNSIVHTFGVPQAPPPAAPGVVNNDRSMPATTPTGHGLVALGSTSHSSASPAATTPAAGTPPASTHTPSSAATMPPSSPPTTWTTTGTLPPPKKTMQKDPGTPPGFPSDWRQRAIDAARAQLQTCAQADQLATVGCPQQTAGAGVLATPDAVHWSILNQPLAGAAAVAQVPAATGASNDTANGTKVSVYGLFQMQVSYTVTGDDSQPYRAYSGGIAHATMTWNGSAFVSVAFATGPVTGPLPSGVSMPPFTRPSAPTNSAVLSALGTGFAACAGASLLGDGSIPNCPQTAPAGSGVGSQWALNGDPLQGAVVTFDAAHGDFTVAGSYAMNVTDASGANAIVVSGTYTATLVFDGTALQLIAIDGS